MHETVSPGTSQSPFSETPVRVLPGTGERLIPRRLLVVEDHESTATVMQKLLQRHGHEVWAALTCQQALEICRAEAVDALICDLDLPDGNGCELLVELQKIRPIKGIVVSGHGESDDLRRSHEAGFVAHLVKPFDITQIEHTLTSVFESKDPALA